MELKDIPPAAFDEFADMHMAWVDKWREHVSGGGYGNFSDLLALVIAWAEKHKIGPA